MLSDREITDYIHNTRAVSLKGTGEGTQNANQAAHLTIRKDTMKTFQIHSQDNSGIPVNPDVPEMRIVRVNTDKTRRLASSETVYHVCFVLSENPVGGWRSAFMEEWKALGETHPELQRVANIDGGFLFVECPLGELAGTILPGLKQAVAAANKSYNGYVQSQEREQTRKEDVWKDERKSVEDMARSLHFE